jgi:hypothetical protein
MGSYMTLILFGMGPLSIPLGRGVFAGDEMPERVVFSALSGGLNPFAGL